MKSQMDTEAELASALKHAQIAVKGFQSLSTSDSRSEVYQLLGQAAVLWSSLETEDDDAAIEAFDIGISALQNAVKLDPGILFLN